jgi:hypothetical protein
VRQVPGFQSLFQGCRSHRLHASIVKERRPIPIDGPATAAVIRFPHSRHVPRSGGPGGMIPPAGPGRRPGGVWGNAPAEDGVWGRIYVNSASATERQRSKAFFPWR